MTDMKKRYVHERSKPDGKAPTSRDVSKAILEAEETIVQIPPSRDEIALEAMKVLINASYSKNRPLEVIEKLPVGISKKAYAIADAMLEAAQ